MDDGSDDPPEVKEYVPPVRKPRVAGAEAISYIHGTDELKHARAQRHQRHLVTAVVRSTLVATKSAKKQARVKEERDVLLTDGRSAPTSAMAAGAQGFMAFGKDGAAKKTRSGHHAGAADGLPDSASALKRFGAIGRKAQAARSAAGTLTRLTVANQAALARRSSAVDIKAQLEAAAATSAAAAAAAVAAISGHAGASLNVVQAGPPGLIHPKAHLHISTDQVKTPVLAMRRAGSTLHQVYKGHLHNDGGTPEQASLVHHGNLEARHHDAADVGDTFTADRARRLASRRRSSVATLPTMDEADGEGGGTTLGSTGRPSTSGSHGYRSTGRRSSVSRGDSRPGTSPGHGFDGGASVRSSATSGRRGSAHKRRGSAHMPAHGHYSQTHTNELYGSPDDEADGGGAGPHGQLATHVGGRALRALDELAQAGVPLVKHIVDPATSGSAALLASADSRTRFVPVGDDVEGGGAGEQGAKEDAEEAESDIRSRSGSSSDSDSDSDDDGGGGATGTDDAKAQVRGRAVKRLSVVMTEVETEAVKTFGELKAIEAVSSYRNSSKLKKAALHVRDSLRIAAVTSGSPLPDAGGRASPAIQVASEEMKAQADARANAARAVADSIMRVSVVEFDELMHKRLRLTKERKTDDSDAYSSGTGHRHRSPSPPDMSEDEKMRRGMGTRRASLSRTASIYQAQDAHAQERIRRDAALAASAASRSSSPSAARPAVDVSPELRGSPIGMLGQTAGTFSIGSAGATPLPSPGAAGSPSPGLERRSSLALIQTRLRARSNSFANLLPPIVLPPEDQRLRPMEVLACMLLEGASSWESPRQAARAIGFCLARETSEHGTEARDHCTASICAAGVLTSLLDLYMGTGPYTFLHKMPYKELFHPSKDIQHHFHKKHGGDKEVLWFFQESAKPDPHEERLRVLYEDEVAAARKARDVAGSLLSELFDSYPGDAVADALERDGLIGPLTAVLSSTGGSDALQGIATSALALIAQSHMRRAIVLTLMRTDDLHRPDTSKAAVATPSTAGGRHGRRGSRVESMKSFHWSSGVLAGEMDSDDEFEAAPTLHLTAKEVARGVMGKLDTPVPNAAVWAELEKMEERAVVLQARNCYYLNMQFAAAKRFTARMARNLRDTEKREAEADLERRKKAARERPKSKSGKPRIRQFRCANPDCERPAPASPAQRRTPSTGAAASGDVTKSGDVAAMGADVVLHRCGACLAVVYCSRDCQRAHWSKHKRDCFSPG